MKPIPLNQVAHKDVWNTDLEQKLFIEIVHWGVQRENPAWALMNNGNGVWNYYITILERIVGTELFEKEIWLPDVATRFSEASPVFITHDYIRAAFNVESWHGGITAYYKEGQVIGHRAVKLGCDYNHLGDEQRNENYGYSIENVLWDACQTAYELKELFKI